MGIAFAEAEAAAARGEVPVGAASSATARSSPAPATGRLAARPHRPCRDAGDSRRGRQRSARERLVGADLYVTLEPCAMCAAAISFARIRRLYYSARRTTRAARWSTAPRFFAQPTCHHAPEVYSGIRERDSRRTAPPLLRRAQGMSPRR